MSKKTYTNIFMLLVFLITACSNSLDVEESLYNSKQENSKEIDITDSTADTSSSARISNSSTKSSTSNLLAIEDSEYPYAGIPRIVIETENQQEILDRETKIPAKLQIWGEKEPESGILELTIRGRGNTSWTDMPKKSYKIEFEQKYSLLGMPQNKDWALIANYADKTLIKNYITYQLSAKLQSYYTPKCTFAEFYLNQEYLGLYLVVETIKEGSNRIDFSKKTNSYIVEFDKKYRSGEIHFYTKNNKALRIHYPKNPTEKEVNTIRKHLNSFETFLTVNDSIQSEKLSNWIDFDESIKHFWVQEFSKNPDAGFYTSIYFTWTYNTPIKMGPVWDFDLAYGGYNKEIRNTPENWIIKNDYWNKYLFQNSQYQQQAKNFWKKNKKIFLAMSDSIDILEAKLTPAANNNFKKWNILKSLKYIYHKKAFNSYNEALLDLKKWIKNRVQWIDDNL